MASHASARRYARSLFDVVSRAGDPDATLAELRAIVGVVTGHAELRRALESPGVPLGAKLTVMREVIALQPISKVVARLMTLIVENDDINELDFIVEAYEQRVMELHQVARADVTSAVPLSPERTRELEEAFTAVTGKRVIVSTRVDPSIIGGIVARIGSRVYDGSVVRHLERVRERLVAEQIL
jgi:F-type H+-transporting ATPase subunit delta